MTNPAYTALLLVIDRSGSMIDIRDEMVQTLETVLTRQAEKPGLLTVDIVTFDTVIEQQARLAQARDIRITLEPRGATALYDAVGVAVTTFGQTLATLPEHARPGIVQVLVVTDGFENSSTEWSASTVRTLITQQRETYSWDFVFLGANQDAVLTATGLGFDADSSLTYDASPDAVEAMTDGLDRYVGSVRAADRVGFTPDERRSARSTRNSG